MSDHKILFPDPEVVLLGRRRIKVKPVQMRHFELFGSAAAGLFSFLQSASVEQMATYGKQHAGELRRVLVATTSLNRFEVRFIPAAQLLQLFTHVLRVNAGFFVKAQVAMATELAGLL